MDLLPVFDIKNSCRICLVCPQTKISLWDYEKCAGTISKQLADMFVECTSVKVEQNGFLSEIICSDCLSMLITMYTFRQRCIETNNYLDKLTTELNKTLEENITVKPQTLEDEEDFNYQTMIFNEEPLNDDGNLNDEKVIFNNEPLYDNESYNEPDFFTEPDSAFEDITDTKPLLDGSGNLLVKELNELPKEEQQKLKVEEVKPDWKIKLRWKIQRCHHCNKSFRFEGTLKRHYYFCASKVIEKSDNEGQRFPCDICHIELDTKPQLVEHFYSHVAVASYFDFKPNEKFYCYACDKTQIIDEVDFMRHISLKGSHSIFICKMCKKSYGPKRSLDLRNHMKIHGVWPYICQICLISFQSENEAQVHVKNHCQDHFKGIYECVLCVEKFTSCSELQEHIKIHSKGVFFCSECDLAFNEIPELESHKQIDHRKPESSSLCPECGFRVDNPRKLRAHIEVYHTDFERAHKCDICQKSYRYAQQLKLHQRRHTNIKPFRCPFDGCNYASVEKSSIPKHVRCIHSDERSYKCSYYGCARSFKISSHLRVHMLKHAGVKKHACSSCDMKFTTNVELKTHILTHTDIRPHSCNICGKSFRKKYYVKIHKQKLHKNCV